MSRIFRGAAIDRPLLKAYPVNLDVMRPLARRVLAHSFNVDNITPNGAVMYRPQLGRFYQLLRQSVLAELRLSGFSHVTSPILRAPGEHYPERPFSTEKMHSDVWRGEPRGSLNVIIPLWGCEDGSIVTFREPAADTFLPLSDYKQGDTSGTDYEVPFREGFIYYFDSWCLHQTLRVGGIARVSIDLRMLYAQQLPGEESDWEWASDYGYLQVA